MEMTIREAGAEGVQMAIRDGMNAARYHRALDEMTGERDRLLAERKKLLHDLRAKDTEIGRLRRQCREYRFSRSQAYRATLDQQANDTGVNRWLLRLLLILSGSVLTFVITTIIIWGSRI